MIHKVIIIAILTLCFLFALLQMIKNKPQYLVLLGIRGFFCMILIQIINALCEIFHLSTILQGNPFTLISGALLGAPGILLLYLSKIYLL